jgi:hypothetical protein
VKNNIVYRLQHDPEPTGGCHDSIFTKGCHNVFYNNIAVDNRCDAAFGSMAYQGVACEELRLERNIFVANGPFCHFHHDWTEHRFAACDDNLYTTSPEEGYRNKTRGGEQSFAEWREAGHDLRSLLGADPLFFDREGGDLRLRYDSPAFALGFEEIDAGRIGLTSDYPFTDPADPIDSVWIHAKGSWANIRLQAGETVPVELLVRTRGGTVADLTHAQIDWSVEDPRVAGVFGNGRLLARSEGITRLSVRVMKAGVKRSSYVYLLVGHSK